MALSVTDIIAAMRSASARLTARLVLLTCLLCPLSESIDAWHATLDNGNDTEFSLIIAALCTGAGFIVVHVILKSGCTGPIASSTLVQGLAARCFVRFLPLRFASTGPPLLALRI